MNFITPYDDNTMIYDMDSHQYRLTIGYVRDELGVDLPSRLNTAQSDDPQKVAEFRLKQVADEVYSYIYAHSSNAMMQEFYAAKLESTREIIRKAMLEQLSYELVSGALSMFSGINVKTGQVIDRQKMKDAVIGFNAQKVLDRIVPELGVALTYQGKFYTPTNIQFRVDY